MTPVSNITAYSYIQLSQPDAKPEGWTSREQTPTFPPHIRVDKRVRDKADRDRHLPACVAHGVLVSSPLLAIARCQNEDSL